MCRLCELAEGGTRGEREGFIITICESCQIPLIVSREHKSQFNREDMEKIELMFPNHRIRWGQRTIRDHAHCHILD